DGIRDFHVTGVQTCALPILLADQDVLKIFHFARFDVAVLAKYLGVVVTPIYCTKIASKLVRTYTDRHGLKDITSELLGVELSKQIGRASCRESVDAQVIVGS